MHKEEFNYNEKALNILSFKRLYYFIGENNLKKIQNYLQQKYPAYTIKFLHIKKFYLAMLEIANIMTYYLYLINNNMEVKDDIQELRNILAHNNLWFMKREGGYEQAFKIMKDALFNLQKYGYYHERADFISKTEAVIDRLKLPIIDGYLIQNTNWNKLKKQKQRQLLLIMLVIWLILLNK